MKRLDVLVVGGGLAGCAVAWSAWDRGWSVGLIDAPQSDSSSRVAAGLVTPITGSRFAISWRWAEFYSNANAFYRRVEFSTGASIWTVAPAWRWFQDHDESQRCTTRWFTDEGQRALAETELVLNAIQAKDAMADRFAWGGVSMEPSARLDTLAYLEVTRMRAARAGTLYDCDLNLQNDVTLGDHRVAIPRLGLEADRLVLCLGIRAREVPWFPLPLHPARGDILEIHAPALQWDHVVHHDGWVVPLKEDRYLVGATYDRHRLDTSTNDPASSSFRETLLARWCAMTGDSLERARSNLVAHRAAIRPASYDRHPLIGMHPKFRHVACLNGLGSKGSLMAPQMASDLMAAWSEDGGTVCAIDRALDWQRKRHA